MNGMFNQNFLTGLIVARERPPQEQFLSGFVAGQMPADSPIGPLLLQPIVSRTTAAEQGRATAESEAAALRQELEIELPDSAAAATLRLPGVTGVSYTRVEGSTGTTVDGTTGVVALPATGNEITVGIVLNGSVRRVTLVRGARTPTQLNGGRALTEAQLAAIGRALVAALQGSASPAAEAILEEAGTVDGETSTATGRTPPSASAKDRSTQKRSETYSAP
jgi:hypothetical protein